MPSSTVCLVSRSAVQLDGVPPNAALHFLATDGFTSPDRCSSTDPRMSSDSVPSAGMCSATSG